MARLPPAHLSIGPKILPNFMSSVFFYCLLAWPTLEEAREFHRVADEKVAAQLRLMLRVQPEVIAQLQFNWPQHDWDRYLYLARQKRRASEGRLQSRLRKRMSAARVAIGLLHEQLPDVRVVLPEGWTSVSIDSLSELARTQLGIGDPENFQKLVWRPSLPIIHLAIATQIELSEVFSGVPLSNISFDDAEFVHAALQRSERYRPIIERHPLFAPSADLRAEVDWLE